MKDEIFEINPEVERALRAGKAVVALESTIIAFGLPFPENENIAKECQKIVRENGAVPATIGVVGGRLKVGLNEDEIHLMATMKGVEKCNLSNLAATCVKKQWGATTVSTTLFAAAVVGIKVFVTGGIGGVHRNLTDKVDVSADLTALSRYRGCVVSSGAKSILDVKSTREILETLGVPVIGYQTDTFPLFFTAESDIKVDNRVETPEEAAMIIKEQERLGFPCGVLCVNPVPRELSIPREMVDKNLPVIESEFAALKEKDGRDYTPFVLKRLAALTGGKSLEANLALIKNNARLGALIAKALE